MKASSRRVRSPRFRHAAVVSSIAGAQLGYMVAGGSLPTWIVTPSLVQMALGLAWLVATDRQSHREAVWIRQILREVDRQKASKRIRIRTDSFSVVIEAADEPAGGDPAM